MKKSLKASAILVLIALILLMLSGCRVYKEDFTVYDCGSGFYFNREDKFNYFISELDLESNGNYFCCEDYFYSEELGKKYTLTDGLFDIGYVYLAKKSDYYNETVYSFDVDSYDQDSILITADMDYVHIFSESGKSKELFIYVEPRDFPLDITLENVNLYTSSAVPVFLSGAKSAINIKLVGSNSFKAGSFGQRSSSNSDLLQNGLTKIENVFNSSYDSLVDYIEGHPDYLSFSNFNQTTYSAIGRICKTSSNLIENFIDGVFNFWGGEEGSEGIRGISCFMHLGGLSFYGDGSIYIEGGKGENGMDASNSLAGSANGGKGGQGGTGLICSYFINHNEVAAISGGDGGKGGAPSKGLWGYAGSSGEYGKEGAKGATTNITVPRREKK